MDIKQPHITASGSLTWYEYDNFIINWTIDLEKNGEPLEFKKDDLIIINFYDKYKNHIAEVKQTPISQTPTSQGLITVTFDSELSNKFPAGEYTYCIKYFDSATSFTTTVAANKKAIVKSCH